MFLGLICFGPTVLVAGCTAMQEVRSNRGARLGSPSKVGRMIGWCNKELLTMLAQMFFPGDVLRQACPGFSSGIQLSRSMAARARLVLGLRPLSPGRRNVGHVSFE